MPRHRRDGWPCLIHGHEDAASCGNTDNHFASIQLPAVVKSDMRGINPILLFPWVSSLQAHDIANGDPNIEMSREALGESQTLSSEPKSCLLKVVWAVAPDQAGDHRLQGVARIAKPIHMI